MNGIRVDFHKPDFNRVSAQKLEVNDPTIDPPAHLVLSALNSFLARLRYVMRVPAVRQIETLDGAPWRLQYLNDDGTELQQKEGFVRGRGTVTFGWSFTAISPEMWRTIFEGLPPEFESPVWDDIRLDAHAALPHVGTSIRLGLLLPRNICREDSECAHDPHEIRSNGHVGG